MTFSLSGSAAVNFFDKEALGRHRKSFRDFSSILDFGCGCGRLIRSLRPLCDQWAAIHGTDIDAGAIAWCKENIADASFSVNAENPPLRFEDKSMDLIYASSVFTHLDAEDQFHWLAELQRIMKPGGYVLLTFRYRYSIDRLADQSCPRSDLGGPQPRRHRLPDDRTLERRIPELLRRGVPHAGVHSEELEPIFRGVRHHHGRHDRAGDRRLART